MMTEMFLNEQKAKDNHIDIEECYLQVDRFFEKHRVFIKVIMMLFRRWLKCSGICLKHHGF